MSRPAVALVPLDDRSVNYECLAVLGAAAGFDLRLPPKAWLGNPWGAGRIDDLAGWVEQAAAQANALVVAVDTLAYGGLVNSRRSPDALATVLERLHVLRRLKAAHPKLTVLAFNVLMRVNRSDDAEEEKPYWAEHGARLFRLSVLEDREVMAVATPDERAEAERLRALIPPEVLADYLAGRARNHAVNRTMIDWTAEGVFDYLIIPQDDTVDYGWNIAESRRLRQYVRERGLTERVSIYPGADETAMLLLARYAAQRAGFRPQVWLRYSGSGADQVITAYEDRPMTEMVKAHLGPLGGWIAPTPEAANLLLFVNAPGEVQGHGPDQYLLALDDAQVEALPASAAAFVRAFRSSPDAADTLREMNTVRRDLPEFVRALAAALAAQQPCAVMDVAYVNAGDAALGELLVRLPNVSQLAAYAGWNTAGNTLGCALAQAVIRCVQLRQGADPEALAAQVRFLFWRLLEDYVYMARLRTQLSVADFPGLGLSPTLGSTGDRYPAVCELVEAGLRREARALAQACFAGATLVAGDTAITVRDLDVAEVALPWGRLFDLTLDVVADYAAG